MKFLKWSPIYIPFFKEEPFLCFDAEHMQVLVEAAYHEYLFVVSNWLWPEELLWLLERAFAHSLNLARLGVEVEAVTDPSVVSSENQDFAVVQSEWTESVSGAPHVVFVHVLKTLPLLLVKVQETIKSFDWFKRCFVHAVSSTNHVNISTVEHSHSVVVAWLLQVANFCPLVLWNVIHFALFGCLIWVLWAYGVNEIFSLELKFPVKVC